MKIKIKDIFKTNKIYSHSANYHLVLDAIHKEIISEDSARILNIYSHHILSGRRIKTNLVNRAFKIICALDKNYADKPLIIRKIQNQIALEFSIKNSLDVGVANIEILKTKIKCQFWLDHLKKWRNLEVIF